MPNRSNGEAVRMRVLEAQKVVVSAILNEWRREHGISYIIIVHNNGTPGPEVFTRGRIAEDHWNDVYNAMKSASSTMETTKGDVKL